ncbi:MAG: hypothetical protein ACRDQA_21970 [Nocardioidaceae bacterium]
MVQEPGRALDLAGATRCGQQLFFANMVFHRPRTPRLKPDPRTGKRKSVGGWNRPGPPPAELEVSDCEQPVLFEMAPDPEVVRRRALLEDSELTRYCAAIVREHAERFGWSKRQRNDVTRSLRLLQTLRDTPTAKIRATEVLQLPRYDGNIVSTLDVLNAAGLLIDDRPTRVARYFTTKTDALPAVIKEQLEVWLQVMLDGSSTAPRQRSRDPLTVRIHIMGIAPILTAWAEAGHQSLAEITTADITAALPPKGSQRNWAEFGLRSLFKTLKARKMIFADPMRGMKSTPVARNLPLPLDSALIRAELDSPDPAVALAVALVAFHALTARQITELRLCDIVDGRLTLDGRSIPMAAPVRIRLTAWLDHRGRVWPNTPNPHLLVHHRSAPRLLAAAAGFPWSRSTLRPQALREDRILSEIHATGGDVRRICDLFGITISSASRYRDTLEHADLAVPGTQVRRT